jgi:acyl-coenzyme A synthetase/AMP-(fatty) acid ligase
MVADAAEGAPALALRCVVFGGEALDPHMLRPWIERHGDEKPKLVNMYGITETTVHVTYRRIRQADCIEGASSPLGQALPDLSFYLLDERMEPVPLGVAGEIYVGGAGVAQGYLGKPALTAQRFVPDPFSTQPGSRLYRSGDRARVRADAEIEYLGRIDHQVKIRGFRVELGEIESTIAAHPDVRAAALVLHALSNGESSLLAYAVPRVGASLSAPELREFLKTRLPEHMLPRSILLLDELPLTRNGKLDESALPTSDGALAASVANYVAPSDELEQELASIWSELLGVERVSVDGNFFELGGHSLLSVRLQAKIQEQFGIKLRIVDLFQYPTVRELGRFLTGCAAAGQSRQLSASRARGESRRTALQRPRRARTNKDREGT